MNGGSPNSGSEAVQSSRRGFVEVMVQRCEHKAARRVDGLGAGVNTEANTGTRNLRNALSVSTDGFTEL